MTFEEKSQWAYGFAALVVPTAYFIWLANTMSEADDVADISYVRALLWAIGAGIVVNMVGSTFVQSGTRGKDRIKDPRDREVGRRADAISFIVFSALIVGPFALALRDAETFWIANAIYACYALTAVLGVVIRTVLYRKGLGS